MTGAHMLEASDRAIFNVLYQMAHDSGELLDPAAEWEIPLATLRQAFSKHEGNTRLRDSLERLRSVKANINYLDDRGEPTRHPDQLVRLLRHPSEGDDPPPYLTIWFTSENDPVP